MPSRTFIPVLVASLTASSSLSYFGLNVTVKAQSMIRPANRHQAEHLSVDACQADFVFEVMLKLFRFLSNLQGQNISKEDEHVVMA